MATCDINGSLATVGAETNVGLYKLWLAVYGKLCEILLQYDAMASCDINASIQRAGCCENASSYKLLLAIYGKLCELEQAVEDAGGGTDNCLTASAIDPVAAPPCDLAFHFNTATNFLWMWDGAAWVSLFEVP